MDVILDWGFWQKEEREAAKRFYRSHGIPFEFHYMDTGDREWSAYIRKRNEAVQAGKTSAYYIDSGLAAKAGALFETPDREEMDVWIRQPEAPC